MERSCRGIALLEVLVASVVVAIMAGGLLQVLGLALLMETAAERHFDDELERWNAFQEERVRDPRDFLGEDGMLDALESLETEEK